MWDEFRVLDDVRGGEVIFTWDLNKQSPRYMYMHTYSHPFPTSIQVHMTLRTRSLRAALVQLCESRCDKVWNPA